MAQITIHDVRDLDQDARRTLETLLGRQLAEEEQITVTALAARPARSGEPRRLAAERLTQSLDAVSESAKAVPADELESLIEEAMNDVRPRRR
jgi:hypothetical protein